MTFEPITRSQRDKAQQASFRTAWGLYVKLVRWFGSERRALEAWARRA